MHGPLNVKDTHKLTCGSKITGFIKTNEVEFRYNVMEGAEYLCVVINYCCSN